MVLQVSCGGYLVREFKSCANEVYGSDRDVSSGIAELDAYRSCDITDAVSVNSVVEELQPEVIVNLAAISSVGRSWTMPQSTMSVNVNGPLNVLEAVKDLNMSPKILLIGSSEEHKSSDKPPKETDLVDASNPYGVSKIV